jgi:hypothetical protein
MAPEHGPVFRAGKPEARFPPIHSGITRHRAPVLFLLSSFSLFFLFRQENDGPGQGERIKRKRKEERGLPAQHPA